MGSQLQVLITGDISIRGVVGDALPTGIPEEAKPIGTTPDLSDPAIVHIPQNSLQLHFLLGFGVGEDRLVEWSDSCAARQTNFPRIAEFTFTLCKGKSAPIPHGKRGAAAFKTSEPKSDATGPRMHAGEVLATR